MPRLRGWAYEPAPLKGKKGMNANIPNDTRKAVYRRDGYMCAMCGGTDGLQVHHAVKRSLGGSDFADNLVSLCWKCHAAAHGVRIEDYPDYIDETWMEQHIAEYLADYYAENFGDVWYPYK